MRIEKVEGVSGVRRSVKGQKRGTKMGARKRHLGKKVEESGES